ncbi:hypothetical protein Bhyg_15384 [Pseudolycoriella hygida]|uniref:Uncharacterized protein n=1 Tax=Pseudolycoriella hygida TaxID=35572 RepID=A0A9Q0MSF1_9DIPT|nr:hypothetical protein Bhyg_15384 [Pseudolycoriella hygida]
MTVKKLSQIIYLFHLNLMSVVGLPDIDKFRLPDELESVDVAIGAVDRIICLFCCTPADDILINDRCFGDEQSREDDAITILHSI